MAIEIPLNQLFKLGPFIFKITVNFCKILVANLSSHENGDECQRAVIRTSGWTDAVLPLSLLSQAACFVFPNTCTPARMQFCRAHFLVAFLNFLKTKILFSWGPSHYVSSVNTSLKGFVSVPLYLLYVMYVTSCTDSFAIWKPTACIYHHSILLFF